MATPTFYKKVRAFCNKEGISFIVDETKTGMGASGKNWAHEYWYLNEGHAPCFVTFGGKSGVSGFFSNTEHRLTDSDTWKLSQNVNVGKLLKYGQTWQTIDNEGLLHL